MASYTIKNLKDVDDSMACANLDLVRSLYADWKRGDLNGVCWTGSTWNGAPPC